MKDIILKKTKKTARTSKTAKTHKRYNLSISMPNYHQQNFQGQIQLAFYLMKFKTQFENRC